MNDGAVMMNWAKSQKVGLSMLSFLGDPNSEFTRALVSSNTVDVMFRIGCSFDNHITMLAGP